MVDANGRSAIKHVYFPAIVKCGAALFILLGGKSASAQPAAEAVYIGCSGVGHNWRHNPNNDSDESTDNTFEDHFRITPESILSFDNYVKEYKPMNYNCSISPREIDCNLDIAPVRTNNGDTLQEHHHVEINRINGTLYMGWEIRRKDSGGIQVRLYPLKEFKVDCQREGDLSALTHPKF